MAIERQGALHLPRSLRVEDLWNEVDTEVRVERSEIDLDLPDRMFIPTDLQRGRCP